MGALLVVGLSGQVGEAIAPRLAARGTPVQALSRQHRTDGPGIEWIHGSLEAMPALADEAGAILSLGPLDAFASWYARSAARATRVVALSSTGRNDKRLSPDPAERELAARLAAAEAGLFDAARQRGADLTILRPSLIYGGDRDLSLTPLVERARRWRVLPLPADARGLRQPVHVEDVAGAVLACLDRCDDTAGRAFDLPGGELLRFDEMVRRTLARRAPGARVLQLPSPLFDAVMACVRWLGGAVPGAGSRNRLALDQVSDPAAARAAFGYAPRGFRP